MKGLICLFACLLCFQISLSCFAIEPEGNTTQVHPDWESYDRDLDVRALEWARPCDMEQGLCQAETRLRELGIVPAMFPANIDPGASKAASILLVGPIYYLKWGVHEPGVFVVGNELHLDRRRVVEIWVKPKGEERNIILADIFGLVR